ncbi:hypothetical protein [Anabaenopsis arnoldii]|uniref:Uncharacterized protein n=1 Tax=Anabaenopsis arnoldii TaxID=2152938 RepID=A0ABT5ASJ8_9CYAN|nr:hypothetical protein [Anabaenopsis arnoldii]MDB9540265.1 hypothetical protein [Anabaenopsis arnoldii]MDH6092663.1 hypothetical protein [Anabaenopsis arnoldii]
MLSTESEISAELAAALLTHYSFDLSGYTARDLINRWQTQYPLNWLHLAVIEALYQGRYKAISVQQILLFWQRRGQVIYHFNMEFERLICSKFPESLTQQATPVLPAINKPIRQGSGSTDKPVTTNCLPDDLKNGYRQSHTTTQQGINSQEEEKNRTLVSTGVNLAVSGSDSRLNLPRYHERNSPLPKPHQQTKLIASSANHPPIGQFTPATGNYSDSFTSKLKAMSDEKS